MIPLPESLQAALDEPWRPVGTAGLVVTSLGFGLLFILALGSEPGWIPLLDGVNLLFHEAGHPLFGLFGWEPLTVLGGTLMQLLVPLGVTGSFLLRRDTVGVAVAGVWTFENLLNIARYVADARAQVLPLVGGGEHDWAELLGRWGCLAQDTVLGQVLRAMGWLGMLACWAWLIWRWRASRPA
ncbi:MAG: hypothetical protein IPP58_02030 [Holophagaceae bacterium]|uniref:Uncharacterized protein n=1 Tax=Candidatus Geothrix skivensis TaxID=2954439 RepID=A0A9D7XK69_9BACT|nr:hypothetical protein [Candidatus Geothrix skivensis]